jgi:hypothetical protein
MFSHAWYSLDFGFRPSHGCFQPYILGPQASCVASDADFELDATPLQHVCWITDLLVNAASRA